ncbi:hypothetical protein [Tolypothrix sp. VBCCA 56010]|uniref:hypothetical protein n=1 Tax=Tolypothrix sp. VBCCA 56010 TaxID=3137731 RepID=UPI003D7CE113
MLRLFTSFSVIVLLAACSALPRVEVYDEIKGCPQKGTVVSKGGEPFVVEKSLEKDSEGNCHRIIINPQQ